MSYEEAADFGRWCRALQDENIPREEEEEVAETTLEALSDEYWYDSERSRYVFHLPTRGPFALPADTVDGIREAYSNLGGGATINQVARRFGMSRSTTTGVIRALGLTHDSPPCGP